MADDEELGEQEYEAVKFRAHDWRQKWHAVAPDANQTMCGLRNLASAECMWRRWVSQMKDERCRHCVRATTRPA